MSKTTYRFRAYEARKVSHPILGGVEKYWLTVRAADFPTNIGTAANARDPIGLNRRVCRDVRDSLEGKTSKLGTFDLMNKGITVLALDVKLVDKDQKLFDVTIDDQKGGIVDGAHTAKIIEQSNEEDTTPEEQHVEVYIRTGIEDDVITDIARGLNTAIQVAPKSIYNIDGVFDWLKEEVSAPRYHGLFAWKETDASEYDVRDLIGILELLNVVDYPNGGGRHPISAYEKWSTPLEKFAGDFEENRKNLRNSKYYRLRKLLRDGLALYDYIRRQFRDIHNQAGGRAGKMNIVEEAGPRRGAFTFPFAGLDPSPYRLTKGATYPILGAFRNYVDLDQKTGEATWRGGFSLVLRVWEEAAPELVEETFNATSEIGRMPDQLGKNRKHWDNLHMKLQLRFLRAQLEAQQAERGGGRKR
ncbi:MAG: AIPR family protein [Planctomycetota bacterium]